MSGREWTTAEIDRLCELAKDRSLRGTSRVLLRPINSVFVKANELGVKFALREKRLWTHQEIAKLWEMAGTRTPRQIARKLGRSWAAVHHKAVELGIQFTTLETIEKVAAYLQVDRSTVTRHRKRLGQKWRLPHSPRPPEIEEVQAIARSIIENPRYGINLKTSLRRLRRIAEGLE